MAVYIKKDKNIFKSFVYEKTFDFLVKRSRSTQGHHFFKLLDPCPQCCIPSPKAIGPLGPEKIFEGFLPYLGMAATLVM